VADTKAMNETGTPYNEQTMPGKTETQEYFQNRNYPLANGVSIAYLIVKAEIEMQHLSLSESTVGQYRHAWMDIRRYFINNGTSDYEKSLLQVFLSEIDSQRESGSMKTWKWKGVDKFSW
jgi:hypothetical protein